MKITNNIILTVILLISLRIPTYAQESFTRIIEDFFKANISETYIYDITIEDKKIYVNQLSLRYLDQELSKLNWEREINTALSGLYNNMSHAIKNSRNDYEAGVSNLLSRITQLKSYNSEKSTTENFGSSTDNPADYGKRDDKTQLDELSSEIQELRTEIEILNERNRQETELLEEKIMKEKEAAKADSLMRHEVSNVASNYVGDNAKQILNKAYPLAMNKLSLKSIEYLGVSKVDMYYKVTIRINYLNLFRKQHYLDLGFKFDQQGQFDSWKFVNHSDIIAPREITIGKLLKLE